MKTQFIKGLIGLALVGFSTLSFSTTPPVPAKQSVSKELVKQTTAAGVTTFDWVIKYENNTGETLRDVEIKDTFSGNQTYVPSSEQHPNGWSATQSGNNIQWDAGFVGAGGYARPFSPPPSGGSFTTSGTGDGYAPIPYNGRKYVLNHHQNNTDLSFQCFGNCTGVWPKMLPDGSGSSLTSTTSHGPETVIIGSKLFYAVTRAADSGLGCYDLDTDTECGYVQLSNQGDVNASKMEGPFKVGGNLYLIGTDIKVHCVNPSSMSSCGTFDLASTLGFSSAFTIGGEVNGNKIYFVTSSGNRVFCFDTTSNTTCWSSANTQSPGAVVYGPASFLYYNTSMVATHICAYNSIQECFDLNNGSATTSLTSIGPSYSNGYGGEFLYANKTYFPSIFTGNVSCFDWVLNAPCTPATINDSTASNYAAAIDDAGCAWVYGHNKVMWSFDPDTNTSPCVKSEFSFEDTFDASKNWCATQDPQWAYTQFKITGIHAADYEELIVEFLDSNGTVIKTTDITGATSHSQGLSTAPFTVGEPIHYRIKVKLASGVTEYRNIPMVTIGVDGPPLEFCLQTTVDCPNTEPVVNSVRAKILANELPKQGYQPVFDEVTVDADSTCILPPLPKSCLVIKPKVECVKGELQLSFTNSTIGFNPTDLDITSLTTGVTVEGNSPSWTLKGATPGTIVKLFANGVEKNAGSEKGTDLCCSSEVEIEIPEKECGGGGDPESCMVAQTSPAGPFFDANNNQWSFPLALTSSNGNILNEVKVTPVTAGITITNGPIYPVGTPSLSFTGVTAGQMAEFKFCAYDKNDMEDNETFDCCKVNVQIKIRESKSPDDYQDLEVVK